MKKEISTALVGSGKAADMHAKALLNIRENKLAAVCGRSIEKARRFAERYKINAYTDLREMITREKIDLVIICTPHPNHKEAALAALQAGSNVLVEKPLASSIEDCDAMIDMAAKSKKTLIIHTLRWRIRHPQSSVSKMGRSQIFLPAMRRNREFMERFMFMDRTAPQLAYKQMVAPCSSRACQPCRNLRRTIFGQSREKN